MKTTSTHTPARHGTYIRAQLALMAVLVMVLVGAGRAEESCKDLYNSDRSFLSNPDESILIAGVIGWCRNHKRRIVWDERYAAVARKWSGFLVEMGGPGSKSLPQDRLKFELLRQGVTDAAVLPFSTIGPSEKIPPSLMKFLDDQVQRGRYTHFAIGVTRTADQKQMVTTLILARRPAFIKPFPVCPAPGSRQTMELALLRAYSHPVWLMTTPKGDVKKGTLNYDEGKWTSEIAFDSGPGEYTMELTVNGPTGPEVAALFPLYCGMQRPSIPRIKARPAPNRYHNPAEAEAAMVAMINKDRASLELPPLSKDDELCKIARAHAMQLLFDRHATHRSKKSGALVDRLRKARVKFDRALENVSLSSSPEAAHDRLMSSPSHRINILDPDVTVVGVGVAMERTPEEDIVAVCEVFLELPETGPELTTVKKLLDLVNDRRRKKGRFALGLDNDLSRLARQSARRLMALDTKADPGSEGDLLMQELEDDWGVSDAAIRYFHTTNPGRILASPEILEEGFNRLGVGIARSHDRSKSGQMWIAIIFAGR